MTEALLTTKLYMPPANPRLVTRSRLIERLTAGLPGKMTLISAPAGFGKTTLVSEWLRHTETRSTWLSLDEGDNDLVGFFSYLVAALQHVDERIGRSVHSLLQSPQLPSPRGLITTLINDMSVIGAPTPFVLVLDDFHLIEDLPSLRAMELLLEHQPPEMHLVIATRSDPPLPLAKLRAQGQMTELRAADLRFTEAEVAIFLNDMMGLKLSSKDVTTLEKRTEGWIAGLQLAAHSLRDEDKPSKFVEAFAGDDRHVMDYLVDEVLSRQSEEMHSFLLHTSILERLSGPLCDAIVYGSESHGASQDILEYLDQANLFIIPLDTRRGWYRYHHLFADLLGNRLRREEPEWILEAHRRASTWYEGEDLMDEAVHHALVGEDYERTAALIEPIAMTLVTEGRLAKLLGWLDRLPDDVRNIRPWLCIARAWASLLSGQIKAVDPLLQHTEAILAATTSETYVDYDRITSHIATIRAFVARWQGDLQLSIELSHQAYDHLLKENSITRSALALNLGNAYLETGELVVARSYFEEVIRSGQQAGNYYAVLAAMSSLATLEERQGHLRRAFDTYRRAIQLGTEWGGGQPLPGTGYAYTDFGRLLYELNDLDEALSSLTTGIELGEQAGEESVVLQGLLTLARVKQAQGKAKAALEAYDRAQEIGFHLAKREQNSKVFGLQAQLLLAQGNLGALGRWAVERKPYAGEELDYRSIEEHLALAWVSTALDESAAALELLAPLLEAAESQGRTGDAIKILALQAMALQAQGGIDQAMTNLERALTLAEPKGYIRTFVDQGTPMARLLNRAHSHGITPDYVRQLLAAFSVSEPGQKTQVSSQALASDWIDALSEREIEVLQLIAEGLTNQEVADRLFITLNTTKTHTRNIYEKLDVNNRTQAVNKARALGLINST